VEALKRDQRTVSEYLTRVKELGIEPNFWTSEEYLTNCGAEIHCPFDEWIWPEADGWAVTPPVPTKRLVDRAEGFLATGADDSFFMQTPACPVWSDWYEGRSPDEPPVEDSIGNSPEFLDWEYLYDPKEFLDLRGGRWRTFRKNVRKLPERVGQSPLDYRTAGDPSVSPSTILELIFKWSAVEGATGGIEDEQTVVNYVQNSLERTAKVLWLRGVPIGVNIADANWKYINFRYSFYDPQWPFVSEYLRWRFFTDPDIVASGKLVNDGGTLGHPGLEKFKDRLNPVRKRKVYSWRKADENQSPIFSGHT
jgi:hypothetical protein